MTKKKRTVDQEKWVRLKGFFDSGQFHKCHGFQNMAVTKDGELCIGMTHNNTWGHYSCTYLERGGQRLNEPSKWDLQGRSLDGGSDLYISTIQSGIRVV